MEMCVQAKSVKESFCITLCFNSSMVCCLGMDINPLFRTERSSSGVVNTIFLDLVA